jgi:hypothetical protein
MTIFYGKAKDLAFQPSNKRDWLDYMEKNDGKALVVDIEREYGTRSDNQNRYYWLCLGVISNHTGYSSTELHELFKRLFLPPKIKKILGREVKWPASTTELNKSDFAEYMLRIGAEVATMGITLPTPIKDEAPLR